MTGETNRQLSISEDKLYRALGELELRLVTQLATRSSVESLENRVGALEQSRLTRAHMEGDVKDHATRIDKLEDAESGRRVSMRLVKGAVIGGLFGMVALVSDVVILIYYAHKL